MGACFDVNDGAVQAVVRPLPGQGTNYCGIGACSAFDDMLINSLAPFIYSKVAFSAQANAAVDYVIAATTRQAFGYVVGDPAVAPAAGNSGLVLAKTLSNTNMMAFENPVPQNSNLLFGVVGMSVHLDPTPYNNTITPGTKTIPAFISQGADYTGPSGRALMNDLQLQLVYGNNGCTHNLGLACQWEVHENDGDAVQAGGHQFKATNAVFMIDSLQNARRTVMNLTLSTGITVSVTSLPLTALLCFQEVEVRLYGFLCAMPAPGSIVTEKPGSLAKGNAAGAYFVAR